MLQLKVALRTQAQPQNWRTGLVPLQPHRLAVLVLAQQTLLLLPQ
jgi:hypothetical protein